MNELGWIDEIDLRREFARIEQAFQAEVGAGRVPTALVARVGARSPAAMVDLLVGPRAASGPLAVRAALGVIDLLERHVPPKALFRRLIELAGPAAVEVLAVAVARHPLGTDWLLPLSIKAEGPAAGRSLLASVRDRPELAMACQACAARGLFPALFELAQEGGRPEPAIALAQAGLVAEAAKAAALALDRSSDREVVLAAVQFAWGSDWESLARRVLPHLEQRDSVKSLRSLLLPGSPVLPLLQAVERGLAGG